MTHRVRFPVEALPEGSAKGFRRGGKPFWFAVRKAGKIHAYVDRCPHYGRTALAWRDDAYLDGERRHIRCAAHNALFDIETGRGTAGACLGMTLVSLPVSVEDGTVCVDLSEAIERFEKPRAGTR